MMKLHHNARKLLERYLGRVREAFGSREETSAAHDVDPDEIVEDIRRHVFDTLDAHAEPISVTRLQQVLDELGNPAEWAGATEKGRLRAGEAPLATNARRDDWHLAYVSLTLLLLAFALPPFLWVLAFGAFLTARASARAATASSEADRASQAYLRNPALILVYVPLMMGLLLWPAIALRFGADFIVDHPSFATRFGIEFAWLAERIATIRLSTFDPSTSLDNAVRNGHWLVFPVGCWLVALALIVRLAPRRAAALFRPFIERTQPLAWTLFFCGALLATSAVALVLLKHCLQHGSSVV